MPKDILVVKSVAAKGDETPSGLEANIRRSMAEVGIFEVQKNQFPFVEAEARAVRSIERIAKKHGATAAVIEGETWSHPTTWLAQLLRSSQSYCAVGKLYAFRTQNYQH